LRINKCYPY